jgi:hypothetical protein
MEGHPDLAAYPAAAFKDAMTATNIDSHRWGVEASSSLHLSKRIAPPSGAPACGRLLKRSILTYTTYTQFNQLIIDYTMSIRHLMLPNSQFVLPCTA